MGIVIGDLITYGIIFTITKDMDPKYSFLFTAAITVCFAISFLFIVKEPDMHKIHRASTERMREDNPDDFKDEDFEDLPIHK